MICRDERDPRVAEAKRLLGFGVIDDLFDRELEQRLRGVQLVYKLVPHGQLDKATMAVIGVSQ